MMGMRKLLVLETNLKGRIKWNSVKMSCTTVSCICYAIPCGSVVTLLGLQHISLLSCSMATYSQGCSCHAHVSHNVCADYATTTFEAVNTPGATMAGLHASECQLWCICGESYQEALVVGHIHCWLTSWWQIFNTLYLQSLLRVTQAVTRRVNGSMGVMEQQSLCRCRHVLQPDALIQLTHTEPTLTP